MKKVENNVARSLYGGVAITTIVNAAVKVADLILEIGRSLGSAISRFSSGNYCP